jgi:two-component system sensor histidine kinase CpxA
MRSLFLKIFLSYWLAQALFVVLAIFVTLAVRERGESSNWARRQAKISGDAARVYESDGQGEVRRYLEDVQGAQHVRVYLFDEHGQEVSGRALPRWAESMAHGTVPPPRDLWQHLTPSPFERQIFTAASGQRYTMVLMLPPGPFGPGGIPGLGIFIAVISSGLVCYLLTRYMTAPVVRLRAATRQLAAGDLSARVGGLAARGGDEIAQLVRDFDAMAERLEKSVNAQARLLNDISHELRSPLARLNVALELARQRSGPPAHSALDRIDLESNRLNELIGGLLTIARMDDANEAVKKFPIHLAEMLDDIAQDADYEAQTRNCHVEHLIVEDCWVMGAPVLLRSAIENVVRNATRYTKEGTDVQIRLEAADGANGREAVITVTDSGPGVPEEALDKLFRPFYRIDDARGRQTGGVGLGLAITERAVRLHGGRVKAVNRPEGGLMIEMRLPRAAVDSVQEQATVPILQTGHD